MPEANQEIKLIWGGDSINSKWDPYASLLIPVSLSSCSKQFYMQFDLGAHSSMFYLDKLKEIGLKYPGVVQVTDSTRKLYDFHIKSGKTEIVAREIAVHHLKPVPIDWNRKIIIGTLGADLIANKVAIINYPKRTLSIGNTVPSKLQSGLQLTEFMLAGRSILLPVFY